MKQRDKVLKIMLDSPQKKVWLAKDFQYGKNFIGYEASARMSELAQIYENILIVGKDGRFRTLEVNWDNVEEVNKVKELLNNLENLEEE